MEETEGLPLKTINRSSKRSMSSIDVDANGIPSIPAIIIERHNSLRSDDSHFHSRVATPESNDFRTSTATIDENRLSALPWPNPILKNDRKHSSASAYSRVSFSVINRDRKMQKDANREEITETKEKIREETGENEDCDEESEQERRSIAANTTRQNSSASSIGGISAMFGSSSPFGQNLFKRKNTNATLFDLKKGQRERDPSCYFDDRRCQIDIVLAFRPILGKTRKAAEKELLYRKYRKKFEYKLMREGLMLEHEIAEKSQDGKTCYVKIHAPWDFLCSRAELTELKVPIQETEDAENRGDEDEDMEMAPGCLKQLFEFSRVANKGREKTAREYYCARFDRQRLGMFLVEDKQTFFTPTQRISLVHHLLERTFVDTIREMSLRNDPFGRAGLQEVGIYHMLKYGVYSDMYPLHDCDIVDENKKTPFDKLHPSKQPYRKWLQENWAEFRCWKKSQPLHQIRAYFGEETAMYFAWLGCYTTLLWILAIVAVLCAVYGAVLLPSNVEVSAFCETNMTMCRLCVLKLCPTMPLNHACLLSHLQALVDNDSTVFFCVFTSIWAVCFLELWKRRCNYLATLWNVSQENEVDTADEVLDPEFVERVKTKFFNVVTMQQEPYLLANEKTWRVAVSLLLTAFCIFEVLLWTVVLIIYRIQAYGFLAKKSVKGEFVAAAEQYVYVFVVFTTALIKVVLISVHEKIFEKICWRLTAYEVPRTRSEFESSYMYKYVAFQFANYFGHLLYLSYIKGKFVGPPQSQNNFIERCEPTGCLFDVTVHVVVLFIGKQILFSNCLELLVPKMKGVFRGIGTKKTRSSLNRFTRWEKDFVLIKRQSDLSTEFYNYFEMVLQYGFITIFAPAIPFAAVFALLNNIIEIRIDAKAACLHLRRPIPVSKANIGKWTNILELFTKFAVISNAVTVGWTSGFVDRLLYQYFPREGANTFVDHLFSSFDSEDYGPNHMELRYSHYLSNHTINGTYYGPPRYCHYRSYRINHDQPNKYGQTELSWIMYTVRLAVTLAFMFLVDSIQGLVAYMIPDVPQDVQIRKDREQYLAKQAFLRFDAKKVEGELEDNPFRSNTQNGGPTKRTKDTDHGSELGSMDLFQSNGEASGLWNRLAAAPPKASDRHIAKTLSAVSETTEHSTQAGGSRRDSGESSQPQSASFSDQPPDVLLGMVGSRRRR